MMTWWDIFDALEKLAHFFLLSLVYLLSAFSYLRYCNLYLRFCSRFFFLCSFFFIHSLCVNFHFVGSHCGGCCSKCNSFAVYDLWCYSFFFSAELRYCRKCLRIVYVWKMQTLPRRHSNDGCGLLVFFFFRVYYAFILSNWWVSHLLDNSLRSNHRREYQWTTLCVLFKNKWFRFLLFKRTNKMPSFMWGGFVVWWGQAKENSFLFFHSVRKRNRRREREREREKYIKFCWLHRAYKLYMMSRLAANCSAQIRT